MISGIQVSSLKPLLTSPEQVYEAFKKIKEMGCDIVQLQWIDPSVPISDISDALRTNNLTAVSVQELFPVFDANRDYYYELCRSCNCDELCLSRIPEACTSAAGLIDYAITLSSIHEELQKEGRHLSFHPTKNDFSFVDDSHNDACNCTRKLDVLLKNLPDTVTLCLDLYHVEHAGLSIADTLRHYGARVTEVHFKDYKLLADGSEVLVPAGQGDIAWDEAIKECLHQNVIYGYVEQERWERDPFNCLQEAFDWLNTHYKGMEQTFSPVHTPSDCK